MHERQMEELIISWGWYDQHLVREWQKEVENMVYEEDEWFERKVIWAENGGDESKTEK